MRTLIVSGLLLLTGGFSAASHAQMGPGPGGPPSGGPPGGPGGPGANMGPASSGREFGPPSFRSPNQDWPPVGSSPGSRTPLPGSPPDSGVTKTVPLSDVVSQVQQQFNATAVKADTVREDGQLVYRIRLLSADKSRVWTVNVDASTGQLR